MQKWNRNDANAIILAVTKQNAVQSLIHISSGMIIFQINLDNFGFIWLLFFVHNTNLYFNLRRNCPTAVKKKLQQSILHQTSIPQIKCSKRSKCGLNGLLTFLLHKKYVWSCGTTEDFHFLSGELLAQHTFVFVKRRNVYIIIDEIMFRNHEQLFRHEKTLQIIFENI